MVVYGPASADWGAKNWVAAFRIDNGDQIWKFNLIPDADEPGADTWKDQQARAHGGGSLWTPLSYDEKKGIIYLPVGNPAPDFEGPQREGDDLSTDSVVALDAKTGRMLWFKQFVAHDLHDRDLSQVSPLFEAVVNGKVRALMSVAGKDGLLRVLDRDTHEVIYQVEITTRTGWDNPPTPGGAHSCPGLLGGLEWNGPAFDPNMHALYVSTVDWCGTFKVNPAPTAWEAKAHYYGGSETPDPASEAKGWLQAIDGPTGKVLWKRQWPTPLVAGIAATAGGVLFTGDLNNDFLAIDATNGNTLYRFNTGGSIGGGVVTYGVGDRQYVAATSGVVSGFFGGSGPAAVVVFGLASEHL
jgi:alcohol dehydrogenase (cytochrome c)